jgi:hypothetical protein
LEEKTARRRPDIWYYTKEKNGNTNELNLDLIEVTIPWNNVVINPEKFEKGTDDKYKFALFDTKDIMENSLFKARERKEEKYKDIFKEAEIWLKRNEEEINIKHKISKINVKCKYVVISNLGVISKNTEEDVCSIVSANAKEKQRYGRMWLKRMIHQVVRGFFECYINAGREITKLDHVAEVNYDITNLDNSVNMNL